MTDRWHCYVGTFTHFGKSDGIYVLEFDARSGEGTIVQKVVVGDPSYLALASRRRMLYSASHVPSFEGTPGAGIVAWSIHPHSGELTRVGHQVAPNGHAAYISIDQTDRWLLVASSLGGAVSIFPIDADGRPGKASCIIEHDGVAAVPRGQVPERPGWAPVPPGAPLPHAIITDPTNQFAIVPDLGLNRVSLYKFDSALGKLCRNSPSSQPAAPGAGPRHPAFHPSVQVLYVLNEKNSTITVFDYAQTDGNFVPTIAQVVSTLPPDYTGTNITADIHLHPSGQFLYASNRGDDSIAMFAIAANGHLELSQLTGTGGLHPRGFGLTPDGTRLLVANQQSDNLVAFSLDQSTGRMTRMDAVTPLPSPTCIRFLAT